MNKYLQINGWGRSVDGWVGGRLDGCVSGCVVDGW